MAYDFDYPDDANRSNIAVKASYEPLWPVDEVMVAGSLVQPRALAAMSSEDFRKHPSSLHAFALLFMDAHKALVEKKVNKMLIQAQGLDAAPGSTVTRSSHALRVLDVVNDTKSLQWPGPMEAANTTNFFIRLTEEG